MLTGRNAKNYRTLSGVSVDELAELINIDAINRIEDDCGKAVDNDTVMKYYRAINAIKQNKSTKITDITNAESDNIPDTQNTDEPKATEDVAEVKPKTRKPRQPKTKS